MFRYSGKSFGRELMMLALAVAFMFPLYVLVTSSFKTLPQMASPLALPESLRFENYREAWAEGNFGEALMGSFVITAGSITILVFLGSMVGYVLARRRQRLSFGVYLLFIIGIILPFQLGLIPVYELMRDLGLLGTRWSLILYYTGYQMPLTVFLYTGFMRAMPTDYEYAARVDGAGAWQTYWRVALPMVRPITGTVIVLNVIQIWNDFLVPLLFLSGSGRTTVPVAVFSFAGQYGSQWPLLFAGMIIGILPVVVVYSFMAQRLIKSIGSGLKG